MRVHAWNGTAWVQRGVDLDGEAAKDQSGLSVALSADGAIVAIGAPLNDGNGEDAGHVRVYAWTGIAWVRVGTDLNGEAKKDKSGTGVALSADGRTLAIGALENDGNGNKAGHVRVYVVQEHSPPTPPALPPP